MRTPVLALVSAVVVACSLTQGFAQSLFESPRVYRDGRQIVDVGDVDGDGDLDTLRAAVEGGTDFGIEFNDSRGEFTEGPLFAVSDSVGRVLPRFVDLTGDGILDCAFATMNPSTSTHDLTIMVGDGTGSFLMRVSYPTGGFIYPFGIGDANNDGRQDLMLRVASSPIGPAPTMMRWVLTRSSGVPVFGPASPGPSTQPNSTRIVSEDFNADGFDDVVTFDALSSPGIGTIWLTQGGGALMAGPSITLSSHFNSVLKGVISSDIEGDGDQDLLFYLGGFNTLGRLTVWRNDGASVFTEQPFQNLALVIGAGGELYSADYDQDGDDDLVWRAFQNFSVNSSAGGLAFIENTGSGVFVSDWTIRHAQPSLYGVGFADLDGNGAPDFVGPNDVFLNPGLVAAMARRNLPITEARVFDHDADGDPDLISPRLLQASLNDGSGALSESANSRLQLPMDVPGFTTANPYQCDWDGDGDLDVMTELWVFGPPANTFIMQEKFRNDGGATLVSAGPVHQNLSLQTPFRQVFQASTVKTELKLAEQFQDFNGDGLTDFVVSEGLYFASPSGPYLPAPGTLLVNWLPKASGDIDGDSAIDFVAVPVTGPANQVALFRNTGGGTFARTIIPGADAGSGGVALGDLDNDGSDELIVVSNSGSFRIEIYTQASGSMVMAASIPMAEETLPSNIQAADLNLNGRADILLSNDQYHGGRENHFHVYLQTASPLVFEPRMSYVGLGMVEAADLDGDGDLDLVGRRAVLNRSLESPAAGSRRQFGVGVSGGLGVTPLLGATGPFRVGEAGVLRMVGVPGGIPGVMSFGYQESNLPNFAFAGLTVYNAPWFALVPFMTPGPPGVVGAGDLQISAAFPGGLANTSVYLQVAFADAAAPLGFSSTNGLALSIGP